MDEIRKTGRVTIPTDLDVVPETLEILKKWGADAIRDCDGTDFPQQLKNADAKIYSTYYTTRKDNAWAKANPDEVQQCYIMTGFYTAPGDTVTIPLMKGISPELMQVNTNDDITRWWEVMDRTTGQPVPPEQWSYADGSVTVQAVPFHEYTVSFLAYLIWDPVHMYNATTNGWTNFEHQITFDVRQPKTHKYSMERLRKFIAEHPYVNVIRYTTFFHQFTLIFDELKREKFVDWYGYSASVSPYILNQFEQEVGYKFRPEYIIDQGYYNNQYRVPSKEFRDFQAFQRREVAKLAKEMVDITHACGCEAMMFLDKPCVVSAQALSNSLLLHVCKAAVFGEMERDHGTLRKMLSSLAQRTHQLMLDVEGYSLLTGKQRIIGYLLNQVAQEGQGGRDVCVDLSVAKSVIASRLNLTQEHFSRILHELSALELIRVEGRRLRIPDLERLARHQCELAASGR